MLDREKPEPHPGLREWRNGRNTGASSMAIANYLAADRVIDGTNVWPHPIDAADFDRCESLLVSVPSLRLSFVTDMPDASPYWAALVPVWEAIKAAENKSSAIRDIIGPIEDCDPTHVRIAEGVSARVPSAPKAKAQDKPRMKETAADREVSDKAFRVAADQIRGFVERSERLEAEKRISRSNKKS